MVAEMSYFLNCADAQAIIGRVYEHKNLREEHKKELTETLIEHMPANCPVPIES